MSRIQVMSVGQVVVDSLQFSQSGTSVGAKALKDSGVDAVALYLGVAKPSTVAAVLSEGMGVLAVTLAGEYNDGSQDELDALHLLGLPPGSTVFLDMEGLAAFKTDPAQLIAKVQAWAAPLSAAGYVAGLYAGVPQPLTSDELYNLKGITRYWKGQGSQRDRNNNLAEPTGCGWCLTQMWPSHTRGNYLVDSNMVGQDYKGRTPTMVKL
jgi:hypothetical protein